MGWVVRAGGLAKDNQKAVLLIDGVLGVVKAYATRVGEGPMPTELQGESGNRLRDSGKEFGSVTGRPRRCGWYDAVVARYAARINGLDSVALTKLDVLDGLDEINVCTGYRYGADTITEWPADLNVLARCEPIYQTLPGWRRPSSGATRYADLPREAQQYVAFLEETTGVPVSIVSTGSGRQDTIIRERSAAAEWFGVGTAL
jgi:adenylosuccinate synthase